MLKFHKEHPRLINDWFWDMCSEWIYQERYLKNGRKMFSIHSNVNEGERLRDIATSDTHVYLIRDHKVTKEGLEILKKAKI